MGGGALLTPLFGIEEILLIPLVFGAFSFGAGWGQRAYGGIIAGVLSTGFAFKTMMPGLDVRWIRLWPATALAELVVIWSAACWIGYLGGSGGWFGRRARARRGAVAPPVPPWAWLPLILTVAGILWLGRDGLTELYRNGGRVRGGVPMAAPPQMIHRLASAPLPNRASWGLVLMLVPFVGPGLVAASAGLANRNLALVSMGGVIGVLPVVICLLDPGMRLSRDMQAALGGLAAVAAVVGWRWGLTHHRLAAGHGRPTTWQWDHTRDRFEIAMDKLRREREAGRRGEE